MTLNDVLEELHSLGDPQVAAFKQRKYAIHTKNSLGIYQKELKALAKRIGANNELALALFDTEIYEARLLTPLLYDPALITKRQFNSWVKCFDNWEICDSFCMGFLVKSPHAVAKARQWSNNKNEFTKRAAFTIMAAYGFAHKNEGNELFASFLPLIIEQSSDSRNFVKKAVNWALRSIGKRNQDLRVLAIETAQRIMQQGKEENSKSKLWIAKDALRELSKESVNILDYPRHIYRPN